MTKKIMIGIVTNDKQEKNQVNIKYYQVNIIKLSSPYVLYQA